MYRIESVNKRMYLKYLRKTGVLQAMLDGVFLLGLVFIIMTEFALGARGIPIMELVVLCSALLGTKLAHTKGWAMPHTHYVSYGAAVLTSAIMLHAVCSYNDMFTIALWYVLGRGLTTVFRGVANEADMEYITHAYTTPAARRMAKLLRKRDSYWSTFAALTGGVGSVIVFTIFNADPRDVVVVVYIIDILLTVSVIHSVRKYLT